MGKRPAYPINYKNEGYYVLVICVRSDLPKEIESVADF